MKTINVLDPNYNCLIDDKSNDQCKSQNYHGFSSRLLKLPSSSLIASLLRSTAI